ncbi:hypothetical protein [Hoeflea poritis]|uniref:Uncharacterized protein n=1 Tax=Hoeflea poritis TaxID=2993659 RepID=A0ABT4VMJ5_9HYPH|nr:hypothetical protein [Hoeflea poritis]MDA4845942.1 hypothetical protein [Hoeflea poritis]
MNTKSALSEEDRKQLTDQEIANFEEIEALEAGGSDDDEAAAAQKAEEDAAKAAAAEVEKKSQEAAEAAAKAEAEAKAKDDAEKKAAEDAAAAAEATKKAEEDGKTGDDAENKGGDTDEGSGSEKVAHQPDPKPAAQDLPVFKPPEGADDRLQEIEKSLDDLAEKFDDGEITAKEKRDQEKELQKEQRSLERQIDQAAMSERFAEGQEATRAKEWTDACTTFMDEHKDDYPQGSDAYLMLDSFVRAMNVDSGNARDPRFLEQAHQKVQKLLHPPKGDDTTNKDDPDKNKQRDDPPPTLGNVPASQINDTEDGKFAHIDRLSGEEYEKAVAGLSDKEREEYAARG